MHRHALCFVHGMPTSSLATAPHTPFEDGQAGLITGGTAGAAFVLHHLTGISFDKLFFAVNLPFYGFAWKRMGREFTLKTLGAVSLLTVLTEWSPALFAIERLHPAYAAMLGGLPLEQALYSVLGALVMSLFLAINHRPGRYTGN